MDPITICPSELHEPNRSSVLSLTTHSFVRESLANQPLSRHQPVLPKAKLQLTPGLLVLRVPEA